MSNLPFGIRCGPENPEPAVIATAAKRFKHAAQIAETNFFKGGGDPLPFFRGEKPVQFNRFAVFNGLRQMPVNRAGRKAPFTGDLLHGLAGAKAAHGITR